MLRISNANIFIDVKSNSPILVQCSLPACLMFPSAVLSVIVDTSIFVVGHVFLSKPHSREWII